MFVIQCIYNQPEPNLTMSNNIFFPTISEVTLLNMINPHVSCPADSQKTPDFAPDQSFLEATPDFFFPPLERTSGKDFFFSNIVIFHIQQEVIALISVWPQIFLSEIYKERNTDKAFMYLFSGLLQ